MLKLLRIIFSVIVISLAGYGLINENFEFQPVMMLFLSLVMLLMGIEEFQKGKKGTGWLSIGVFIFILFVSMKGFILN
ncbi:hypothetical protein DRW41_10945 [Neobacillus piezotolerans]|uniref:DUF3953 domain-containing protein n=1 Tax=Neobacillus piezotolerans TaxID=2259171 RepID=A0A3D8GSK4_9BACI|nr:YczI family protein [Neobacillus piezotolerans]RDU37189.1 hypothetical protein DRW41_10945 [Neobacillus piezotolerans]